MINIKLAVSKEEKLTKRARRSRSKGHRGVNGICEIFSSWYEEFESFCPSFSSGAGKRFGQAGDIATPPGFLLVVEAKNDESWNTSQLICIVGRRGADSAFWKFWQQVLKATADYNNNPNCKYTKYPCLIFTKNYDEYLIMLNIDSMPRFASENLPDDCLIVHNPYGQFYIFELESFLSDMPKQALFNQETI